MGPMVIGRRRRLAPWGPAPDTLSVRAATRERRGPLNSSNRACFTLLRESQWSLCGIRRTVRSHLDHGSVRVAMVAARQNDDRRVCIKGACFSPSAHPQLCVATSVTRNRLGYVSRRSAWSKCADSPTEKLGSVIACRSRPVCVNPCFVAAELVRTGVFAPRQRRRRDGPGSH